MPLSPRFFSAVEEHALHLEGLSWRQGSLLWPSSSPPLREERAWLVAGAIPAWAHAGGQTAAWVWTGLGSAEPFDLIAPISPAISPIARATWKPRLKDPAQLDLRRIGGLSLISPTLAFTELLTCSGDDHPIAAQLWHLMRYTAISAVDPHSCHRTHTRCLDRARRRLQLVEQWKALIPS